MHICMRVDATRYSASRSRSFRAGSLGLIIIFVVKRATDNLLFLYYMGPYLYLSGASRIPQGFRTECPAYVPIPAYQPLMVSDSHAYWNPYPLWVGCVLDTGRACAGKSLTPLSYLIKVNNTSILIHE